jgi:hypothetical protein
MARVALLFSGLPRQWEACVESQLRLAHGHDVDVFFHFWDTIDAAEKERILAAYRPKAHRFDAPVNFTAVEPLFKKLDNINSPSRMLSMYYGWAQVARIFEDYRQATDVSYDFAVRLRSDLMFFAPLELGRLGPNDLLLSNHNDFGVINDMFAVGGVVPILYYLSLHTLVLEYKDHVLCNPELMLKHHLERRPATIRLMTAPVEMLVFRPHMVGMPIEECLKQHPGASKWKDPEVLAAHREFHGRRGGAAGVQHVDAFVQAQIKHLRNVDASPSSQSEDVR